MDAAVTGPGPPRAARAAGRNCRWQGPRFSALQAKAQTWALATDPEELPALLRALSAERQRRKATLAAAGVSKWDHYEGGDLMSGYQPDESQVKPNTSKTPKQISDKGAIPPNLLPPPPAGAGVFTIVSGEQCATARAPYLSDAERRRWLASLPERQREQGPDVVPGDLLACMIADATVQPAAPASSDDAPTTQEVADVTSGASALPFSAGEVAVIAARMARGETKTEVVRSMPGYATRRHREFVAYYEAIATTPADAGLLEVSQAATRP